MKPCGRCSNEVQIRTKQSPTRPVDDFYFECSVCVYRATVYKRSLNEAIKVWDNYLWKQANEEQVYKAIKGT